VSSYFNQSPPKADDFGPTAEQWIKIRQACERGDEADAFNPVVDAGIDPRCVKLFIAVLDATRQAADVEQAAHGAEDERRCQSAGKTSQ